MNQVSPKQARKAAIWLSWMTPLAAVVSVVNVAIAVSTSVWLKTTEQILVDSSNSSVLRSEVPRTKNTVSGLWKLCEYHNLTQANATITNCFAIDYFAKERYTPEPHDSTMAIPYTVTKAGPFFFAACSLLLCGILSAVLGYCWRRKRVAIFIAGILFIISGLVMLIGMVVYLSVLQAEVGQKLRPRNSVDKPPFSYTYGYSFILIVVGFMSTEMTGTCAIFWYIYWHQLDWAEKAGGSSSGGSAFESTHRHAHNHHHHHHHNHHGQSRSSQSSSSAHHRHHNHRTHSRRQLQQQHQHSCDSKDDDDCCKDRGCPGNSSNNYYYNDRSASSGEEFDRPYYHRHRSLSHGGGGNIAHDSSNSSGYYTYNKLYPCKKHGTIPPRYSNSRRHHYHHAHQRSLTHQPCSHSEGDTGPMLCTVKCHKCSSLTPPPSYHQRGDHHYCNGYYDDDFLADFEVPLPPPPPIPRDITCTTTVSADEFFLDDHSHSHHHHNNHPFSSSAVPTNTSTTPNASREKNSSRDQRKTTPV